MCETPLEVKFMLRETEVRSRAFSQDVRAEDRAVATGFARMRALLAKWLARPLFGFGLFEKKAN